MLIAPNNLGLLSIAMWFNPFPLSEKACRDSLWFKWMERVELSHDAHYDDIVKVHGEHDRPVSEQHQADADTLFTITESMYASMIVAAQSHMESFHCYVCKSIHINISRTPALYEENSQIKVPERIGAVEDFILKHSKINIREVANFDVADSVRVLANIFKHNMWIYKPRGANIIAPRVLAILGIVPKKQVIYSDLPLIDLLVGCGRYCHNLQHQLIKIYEAN